MTELTINGKQITARAGDTILQAARAAGIRIPSLCSHPNVPATKSIPEPVVYQGERRVFHEAGSEIDPKCRLCLVSIQGREEGVPACETPVETGMVVLTETEALCRYRRDRLTQLLASHPTICLTCDRVPRCPPFGVCVRSANVPDRCVACPGYAACEVIGVADDIGMIGITIPREPIETATVSDNPFFEFDPKLCIGCTRCVRFCAEVRGIGALGAVAKGGRVHIGTKRETFAASGCRFCFGCVAVCPTGALVDKREKWKEAKGVEDRKRDIVPCIAACPLHIDVPRYIDAITRGRFDESLAVIQEKLPFPALCGRVCTHPCESACRRGELDQPVAIRLLKRFVAERAAAAGQTPAPPFSDKRVAVVGSGPAGLTAAYCLRKGGAHAVTVFESFPEPGGMPLTGIPRFRLPRAVMAGEVERVREIGVELKCETLVPSAEALLTDGFDAVLVAIGAHAELTLGVAGEKLPGIRGAIALLRDVAAGNRVDLGRRVAVIGGGNVAIDAARVAKRMGGAEVTVVYRRSINEMPADRDEIEQAAAEDVQFMYLASPIRYEALGSGLRVTCIRHELKRPDASGRRRPKPIKGSEFSVEVDSVITAVGQFPEIPEDLRPDTDAQGRLRVSDPGLMTAIAGIFAAGDAVSGPRTVTEAIAMGAKAATAIHRYLGGEGPLDSIAFDPVSLSPRLLPESAFLEPRGPMPLRPVEDRLTHFEPVELGFSEETALREAGRCLRCSLRLDIDKNG